MKTMYSGLFVRILLVAALLLLTIFLISEGYRYTALLLTLLIVLTCSEIYFFIRSRLVFYDKTITSILHDDYSAGFPEEFKTQGYKSLFDLFHLMKKRQYEQVSRETIYLSILNNVDSGILILQKDAESWSVFLMNDYFSKLFGVPKLKNWDYLKNYLPSLCAEIENTNFSELKLAINIAIDGKEPQTFMMQTSLTRQYGSEYFVVILDSIQRVLEKKEKQAWVNLMKIISHELMNSLTPIRSLSQSLKEIVSQETISSDDLSDIRESLDTIVGRTDHLQAFVENYRKLTILPTPSKSPMDLSTLVADCLKIMSPVLRENQISAESSLPAKLMINADRSQIEQVIINLLTNSIHALKGRDEKQIEISQTLENSRLFLTIADTIAGLEGRVQGLDENLSSLRSNSSSEISKLADDLQKREARLKEVEEILRRRDEATNALKDKLQKALLGFQQSGLSVDIRNGKVYVSLTDKLLFSSGSIVIDERGKMALQELATVLKTQPEINISVEGHTDNQRVVNLGQIKDNWDLSVLRATSVVRFLTEVEKIENSRITATGKGEYQPIEQGSTPDIRSRNRRIEIVLSPKLDELYNLIK